MKTKIAIAWYRREQWSRLLAVSSDSDKLEKTFEEWSENAERHLGKLKADGAEIEKVDVDVEELVRWCKERKQPIAGATRSRFSAEKLRRKDA